MKTFIVLAAVAAFAVAKPSGSLSVLTPISYIATPAVSSQYHSQDELGQYSYGYSDHLSAKAEVKSLDGTVSGGYSYIDAEGKLQSVEYVADALNGFRVAATNLPQPPTPIAEAHHEAPTPVADTPEVAEAKAIHLAAVEEAKARVAAAEAAESTSAVVAPVVALPTTRLLPTHAAVAPITAAAIAPISTTAVSHSSTVHHRAAVAPVVSVRWGAPAGAYSYVIHQGTPHVVATHTIAGTPIVTPYSAHVIASPAHVAVEPIALNSLPVDTPEVAKARAEHLAAVEAVRARDASWH